MIEIIKEKHTDKETALTIENYPYGFRLKTKIRYWIESNKKGDRFLSQTLNPKTNIWNKEKAGVYFSVMVMTRETENGYIKYMALYPTTSKEEILNFIDKIKGYELNNFQAEQLRILKAYSKVYENVSFKVSVRRFKHKITGEETENLPLFNMREYDEINEQGEIINHEQEEQKQKQIKENINKAVGYEYHKLKNVPIGEGL